MPLAAGDSLSRCLRLGPNATVNLDNRVPLTLHAMQQLLRANQTLRLDEIVAERYIETQ